MPSRSAFLNAGHHHQQPLRPTTTHLDSRRAQASTRFGIAVANPMWTHRGQAIKRARRVGPHPSEAPVDEELGSGPRSLVRRQRGRTVRPSACKIRRYSRSDRALGYSPSDAWHVTSRRRTDPVHAGPQRHRPSIDVAVLNAFLTAGELVGRRAHGGIGLERRAAGPTVLAMASPSSTGTMMPAS